MTTASAIQTHPARQCTPAGSHGCSTITNERAAVGLAMAVSAAAALLWGVLLLGGIQLSAWETPQPEPAYHPKLARRAAGPMLPLADAAHGHEVFETTCSVCHGSGGMGKQGLGKSLVHSDFVLALSDSELSAFIARGRDATDPLNTTKVAMPPRGGNQALTGADLASVVIFMRGLQDPRRMPDLPPIVIKVAPPTEAEKAASLAAAGGDPELAEILASGTKLFAKTCAACHGQDAKGLKGLGKDLTISEFVAKTKDDALLTFVKQGRNPGEPGNTTGVAMPPKGGNPALSDDDILDIIAYMRLLQTTAHKSAAPDAK